MPGIIAVLVGLAAWVPLAVFGAVAGNPFSWNWSGIWTGRVLGLAVNSMVTALATALVVVVAGLVLCEALERRPQRERFWWLGSYGLAALVSPYVVVQGWINLWGQGGWLREAVGWGGSDRFTLYSFGGSLAMHSLLWLPAGVVMLWAARTGLSEKHEDFRDLYRPGWRASLNTYFRAKYEVGTMAVAIYTSITVFWSYEIPSILRQPSLAMEVMAAFGSFYDYTAAGVLVVPAVAVTVVLGLTALPLFRGNGLVWRRMGARQQPRRPWAGWALTLPLLAGLGVCLAGLFFRLFHQPAEIGPALALARPDFINTGLVGLGVGIGFAGIAVVGGWGWRLHGNNSGKTAGLGLALGALAVPPVMAGIGWVHLYGTAAMVGMPRSVLRLILMDTVLLAPMALLLGYVATAGWSESWSRELGQFGRQSEALRVGWRLFAKQWVLLGAVGSAWAMREVGASLLNYPPGGSTLAVTIETMLHYEQPTALSALSLAQLFLVATFWACGLTLYRYLEKRWN